MNIRQYLDSTYLKTANQAGLTEVENQKVVEKYVNEAIKEKFKLIMIRPEMVAIARSLVTEANSSLLVGTVIDFPKGNSAIEMKLKEATKAIGDGADDLDFVCNYEAFKNGNTALLKDEILQGTKLGLDNNKVVKWIIEVAALSDKQIIKLAALIKNVVLSNFNESDYCSVFVKSSTGFFQTENHLPNGATQETVIMMLENASPLPIKAAGGVRTYEEAIAMIQLGVKRIGTSNAKTIADGGKSATDY